jgi:hypothetical protein
MVNRTNPIYHFLSSSVSSPQKIFLIPLKNGSSVSPHGSEEAKKEMSKKQVEQRTKERRGENWTSQDRPARPSLPRVAASALAGAPQLCVRPAPARALPHPHAPREASSNRRNQLESQVGLSISHSIYLLEISSRLHALSK